MVREYLPRLDGSAPDRHQTLSGPLLTGPEILEAVLGDTRDLDEGERPRHQARLLEDEQPVRRPGVGTERAVGVGPGEATSHDRTGAAHLHERMIGPLA